MNRLDRHFRRQRELGKGVLITYFPIGEPKYDTLELAETYIENGSDLFEIGLPVPDPFADGKAVSDSMKRVREAA
ncbi:MAG: tryptophan synthase subunit alpha, partial [Lachnospiraceae bacterium]|nr:tryptophan synthase subunit alpha [Lachnospiraceae bacterium]